MEYDPNDMEGGLYTLGLLEQLRAECKELWGASSRSYFRVDELLRELGNPNLHEIFRVSTFESSCGIVTHSTFDGYLLPQLRSPSRTLRSTLRSVNTLVSD